MGTGERERRVGGETRHERRKGHGRRTGMGGTKGMGGEKGMSATKGMRGETVWTPQGAHGAEALSSMVRARRPGAAIAAAPLSLSSAQRAQPNARAQSVR
eukprot:4650913-Prymnesium_polylepis.2